MRPFGIVVTTMVMRLGRVSILFGPERRDSPGRRGRCSFDSLPDVWVAGRITPPPLGRGRRFILTRLLERDDGGQRSVLEGAAVQHNRVGAESRTLEAS